MTRINVVPVEELTDEHLRAEFREIPRVVTYVEKHGVPFKAPDSYCLGTGHVKWAASHLYFVYERYKELIDEMELRGFNVNYADDTCDRFTFQLFDRVHTHEPTDYAVTDKDRVINRTRILSRIAANPSKYHYYNTKIKA